jgi:hypothetical protein
MSGSYLELTQNPRIAGAFDVLTGVADALYNAATVMIIILNSDTTTMIQVARNIPGVAYQPKVRRPKWWKWSG